MTLPPPYSPQVSGAGREAGRGRVQGRVPQVVE
jgi:hypothetical protein